MEKRTIDTLSLDGGWLCLDFINTVHDRTVKEPFDYLLNYDDLLEWSVKLETLTSAERNELKSIARKDQDEVDIVMSYSKKVRSALYQYFLTIAHNEPPEEELQIQFNSLLTEAMSQSKLQVDEDLTVRQYWESKTALNYPLHPIIKSAYDLLTSGMLDRVKSCGACGWLFLDQSKNKSRKWCSMESCGSNVKARRYYHRKKKKG